KGWPASEIVKQIEIARSGAILFSAKILMENRDGLCDALQRGVYADVALPPTCPWLSDPPATPQARVSEIDGGRSLRLVMRPGSSAAPRFWHLRLRFASGWQSVTIDGSTPSFVMPNRSDDPVELVALSAVDAAGNLSSPVVVR